VGGIRQTEMDTAEPFMPEPSASEAEVAIGKLRRYISPGVDQIPAELILAGGDTLHSEIHKLIELEQRRIATPLERVKKGNKTDSSDYQGISLLSTSYKILSNILLARLTPYAEEIIGDHQFGFRCNRSMTDQIFCIQLILGKKVGV
jgi:hypothetical protein